MDPSPHSWCIRTIEYFIIFFLLWLYIFLFLFRCIIYLFSILQNCIFLYFYINMNGYCEEWRRLIVFLWLTLEIDTYGRILQITVISRRSRFFAGTRFLKRGLNEQGHFFNHLVFITFQKVQSYSMSSLIISLSLCLFFWSFWLPLRLCSKRCGNRTNCLRTQYRTVYIRTLFLFCSTSWLHSTLLVSREQFNRSQTSNHQYITNRSIPIIQ